MEKIPINREVKKEMFDFRSRQVINLLKEGKYDEASESFRKFVEDARNINETFILIP